MVNSEELIGTTEYLTLYTGCRTNRCRYNRVRSYLCENSLFSFKYYSSSHLPSNIEAVISTVIRKNILLDFPPLLIVFIHSFTHIQP